MNKFHFFFLQILTVPFFFIHTVDYSNTQANQDIEARLSESCISLNATFTLCSRRPRQPRLPET